METDDENKLKELPASLKALSGAESIKENLCVQRKKRLVGHKSHTTGC